MPPVVPGALGFVRWNERTSSGDTGLCPVRVTSVLPSGKFHCDFIGCGGQHSTEPLAASRLIDCDDAEYNGLGSSADAPAAPSHTAARGMGRVATNSAVALPSGKHRFWQVDTPGEKSGALTVPAGGQLCLAPGPLDEGKLTATRKRIVASVIAASAAIGCPVATRTSTNDRHGAGGQRIYLKCAHGILARAPTRLEDAHPGTMLPPKLMSAAAVASQGSAVWRATVTGRVTGSKRHFRWQNSAPRHARQSKSVLALAPRQQCSPTTLRHPLRSRRLAPTGCSQCRRLDSCECRATVVAQHASVILHDCNAA